MSCIGEPSTSTYKADVPESDFPMPSSPNVRVKCGEKQPILQICKSWPTGERFFKITEMTKRWGHPGFHPSCHCSWELRLWFILIGSLHIVKILLYAADVYLPNDFCCLDHAVGGALTLLEVDQKSITNCRPDMFSLLVGVTPVFSGFIIFVGALEKRRLILHLFMVATLALELSFLWSAPQILSPYSSVVQILGSSFNAYFQVVSVALAAHIDLNQHDGELQDTL